MTVASLNPKHNSIGFLRLTLACLVIVSHSYPLGGFGDEPLGVWTHSHATFGGIAVAAFFFLSGYLITQSYVQSQSIIRFLWRRVLRIFPGFWGCLLATTCIFGPLACAIEGSNLLTYFAAKANGPFSYVAANYLLGMKQYGMVGLLSHNPYPGAFDGSLWTLSNEFTCYIAVAVVGVLGALGRRRILVVALLTLLLAMYVVPQQTDRLLLLHVLRVAVFEQRTMLEQAVYFTVGAVYCLFGEHIVLRRRLFYTAIVIVVLTIGYDVGHLLVPFALSYALMWLALHLPLQSFSKHGDYSYGLYIYAFPTQQILASLGINHYGMVLYLALVVALALPLAVLSWHFVEKPCLALKNLTLEDVRNHLTKLTNLPQANALTEVLSRHR